MNANRDTRLMEWPITEAEKTVIKITTGITSVTTIAVRTPRVTRTSKAAKPVATKSLKTSSSTFC
jgi:hypothetical protein